MSHLTHSTEVIEEVVAAVGNAPILRSDVALAELVELVEPEDSERESLYRERLLDARIRLEVQFRDLEESGTLFRLDLEVDPVRAYLVARAGGETKLRAGLAEHGLAWTDLDELSLRMAAVNAYTEQRLRPRIRISLEEIQAAYQQMIVDRLEDAGQPVPPLTTLRDQLHQVLVEQKLNDELEEWLIDATDRREVMRYR
jgi:hypothetical protein